MPWTYPNNLAEFEQALDGHKLYVRMSSGGWWLTRRNGKTKTWKTDPARWEIPLKAGLRACARVSNRSAMTDFRIADSREAAESK